MLSKLFKAECQRLPSIWVKVHDKVRVCLMSWNRHLQKGTQGIRVTRLRLYFFVICICFGFWNTWIIIKAFYQPAAFKMHDQIKIPEYVVQHSQKTRRKAVKEAQSEKGWQEYVDSLKGTQTGKSMLDSMQRMKPGLLDSIDELEGRFDSTP